MTSRHDAGRRRQKPSPQTIAAQAPSRKSRSDSSAGKKSSDRHSRPSGWPVTGVNPPENDSNPPESDSNPPAPRPDAFPAFWASTAPPCRFAPPGWRFAYDATADDWLRWTGRTGARHAGDIARAVVPVLAKQRGISRTHCWPALSASCPTTPGTSRRAGAAHAAVPERRARPEHWRLTAHAPAQWMPGASAPGSIAGACPLFRPGDDVTGGRREDAS